MSNTPSRAAGQQDIAGRWLRVSTGGQDERNQEPDIDRHIAAAGYLTGPTYRLHGASASKGQQDAEFARVLDDIRAGRLTVLVPWKLDRLDRRGILRSLTMVQQIRDLGARVEFATEPQNNGPDADLMLAIGADLARRESATKRDRILASHRALRAANRLVGQAPYGWQILPAGDGHSTIAPDPATAPVVKQVFASYLDGESVAAIARALNAQGIASARGGAWSGEVVAQVLNNRAHCGERLDAQGRVVMTMPAAIIDAATFDAVQSRLRRLGSRRGRTSGDPALLRGLLICARCGSKCYRINGWHGTAYRCHGKNTTERSTCKVMVDLASVDAAVGRAVLDIAQDAPEALAITETTAGTTVASAVAELDARIARLLPALQDGDLDAASFAQQTAELAAERARIVAAGDMPQTERIVGSARDAAAHWSRLTAAEQRAAMADLGWRVVLDRDRTAGTFSVSIVTKRGETLATVSGDAPAMLAA